MAGTPPASRGGGVSILKFLLLLLIYSFKNFLNIFIFIDQFLYCQYLLISRMDKKNKKQ